MTLFGWDASDYDWGRGPMDLGSAFAAGIRFFTHKATEGTNVKHTQFGEAMRRARNAGIPFLGAYHVVRSPRNAAQEVDYFLNYISQQFPEWRSHPGFFVQVDLEKWPYDKVPAVEGEDFGDIVEVRSGKVAIIYASKGQYGNELAGTSHELWNANYPLNYQTGQYRDLYARAGGDSGPGWSSYSGRVPKIWQFTSSAIIGRQPTCDANAFRGSEADFRAMIQRGNPTKGPSMIQVKLGPTIVLTDYATWHKRLTFAELEAMRTAGMVRVDISDAEMQRILSLPQPGVDKIGGTVTPTPEQFADLKTSMLASLPTAADVVDELTRRASAATPAQ